jgi:hypothetical protein
MEPIAPKQPADEVDIDFDGASAAWRANKKYLGNGMFVYRCSYIHSDGKPCRRTVEAQQRVNPYAYRPDWCRPVTQKPMDPMRFCKQHRFRGCQRQLEFESYL